MSGAAQDVAERDARPDGLGDRTDPPREPVPGPVELGTPVPRTFEHHGEGAVLERAERDRRDDHRLGHRASEREGPCVRVDRRGGKVVSAEVRCGRGPALLERRERGGKVHRRLVPAYKYIVYRHCRVLLYGRGAEAVNSLNRSPTDAGSSDPAEVEPAAQEVRQPAAGHAPDVGVAATAQDGGGRRRPAPVGAGDDDRRLWEKRRSRRRRSAAGRATSRGRARAPSPRRHAHRPGRRRRARGRRRRAPPPRRAGARPHSPRRGTRRRRRPGSRRHPRTRPVRASTARVSDSTSDPATAIAAGSRPTAALTPRGELPTRPSGR